MENAPKTAYAKIIIETDDTKSDTVAVINIAKGYTTRIQRVIIDKEEEL